MEQTTTLYSPFDIYDRETINIGDVNNKLFCTFVPLDGVDSFIEDISSQYTILYNKIFVLHIKSNDEYVCTYNVDQPLIIFQTILSWCIGKRRQIPCIRLML